jgi:hypothetical protein
LALAALLPLAFSAGGSASGTTTYPAPWPGLPDQLVPNGYTYFTPSGTWGNGLAEVARAQQWVKVRAQAVAAQIEVSSTQVYPQDDPGGRWKYGDTVADVFLSSPADAKYGYGVGLPITVKTVAFGSIPIEATMQLEQPRDAKALPVPLTARYAQTTYWSNQQVRPGFSSSIRRSVELTGEVRVRVTALSVDGVDLGLSECMSSLIALDLHATPVWNGDPLNDPLLHDPGIYGADALDPTFRAGSTVAANWEAAREQADVDYGGVVSGKVDIPSFTDCRTSSGEDLSSLLTATVSGGENHVAVGLSTINRVAATKQAACGTIKPPLSNAIARGPFAGDPYDCDPDYGPPAFNYPARD